MKLISWNVNGLRSLHRDGYWDWFSAYEPDIFSLQEIKSEKDQLPPEVQTPPGYHSYFNASRERKGYSGVAVYSKIEPKAVEFDVLDDTLNTEGRLIQVSYPKFEFFTGYFPNGGGGPARLAYKMKFYEAFLQYIESLRKKGKSIVFCGDINTAHEAIDLARPKENEKNTGFLPEERAWIDDVIAAGYIDTFRHFYPDKTGAYTYWDQKSRARDRNVGWRIDYFFISPDLLPYLKSTKIHANVFGSDHCPIEIELKV